MKYLPALAFSTVLLCCIAVSGCIGTTTSDIMFGDEKIGVLTLTPQDNLFSGEGSLTDKVNMQVEMFGMTFSRDGVKMSEALDISSLLNSGDLSALDGFNFLSGDISGMELGDLSALLESQGGFADSSESLDTAGKNLEILLNGIFSSI
jgi:hypothetical protein